MRSRARSIARLAILAGAAHLLAGCADTTTPDLAERLTEIATGSAHSCSLTDQGVAHCWGRGFTGELGDGATSVRWHRVVATTPEPLTSITAGYHHTCALGASGVAYCWGWNRYGQVGPGTGQDTVLAPRAVDGSHTFTRLSAGWYHTCGITVDGAVLCWGRNSDGAVGDSTTVDPPSPTMVAGEREYASVTAGGHHTCAITVAGEAFCWGRNTEGQLGDGTAERRLVPTPVAGGPSFSAIDAGRGHTCGLTAEPALFCWGSNARGELGINEAAVPDVPGLRTPGRVPRNEAYSAVSAGADYTCALDAVGVAYCWGAAHHGQLGMTTTEDRWSPTVVLTRRFVRVAASAGTHTCGIDAEQRAACWGTGRLGQLGLSGTIFTPVPVTAVF